MQYSPGEINLAKRVANVWNAHMSWMVYVPKCKKTTMKNTQRKIDEMFSYRQRIKFQRVCEGAVHVCFPSNNQYKCAGISLSKDCPQCYWVFNESSLIVVAILIKLKTATAKPSLFSYTIYRKLYSAIDRQSQRERDREPETENKRQRARDGEQKTETETEKKKQRDRDTESEVNFSAKRVWWIVKGKFILTMCKTNCHI